MKFKPVPEAPENLDFVRDVQRALPLVPDVTDDCCARVMRRAGVENRDTAGTWLTFLRALELAEETEDGTFVRRRREPERNELAESFQTRVYGASTVLGILFDEDPLEADAVFEAFSETVPPSRRGGDSTRAESVWHKRVGNVLDWAVLLGLAERANGGYVRA
ncbi:hypothetical protein [Haladaptatus sp.]|uniref:hypothetical protein n=1 Tax=Haladaptatus sp. TaxID=1973141 RepID=UPI003C6202E0